LRFSESSCAVVDDLNLDELAIEVFNNDLCIFHQLLLNRHVAKEAADDEEECQEKRKEVKRPLQFILEDHIVFFHNMSTEVGD